MDRPIYNIRIKSDIKRPGVNLPAGVCVKAQIYGNGQAKLITGAITLSESEYELAISDSEFTKLLFQV